MAKSEKIHHIMHTYRDEYTGKKVCRLTSPETLSHHPYFYNKIFTNDSSHLIHVMEREGLRNYYKMNLETGDSIQLTEGGGICAFSANLSQDDSALFYCRGNHILRLDMESLEEEVIYTTPEGWWGCDNPGLSNDDKVIVTVEMLEADRIVSGGGWDAFEAQWLKKPRCRLVYINADTGESRIIHEENCWLGHPQVRPGDNEFVSFCHEGPAHKIDARLWFINADGTDMRCAKAQKDNEMISHEYWLSDGSRMAYVYRIQDKLGKATEELVDPETFMPKEEGSRLKENIMFLNPDTLQEEFLMACSTYCHFTSDRTNGKIVGDGQLPEEHFIYLVNVGARKEERLCSHGTSWRSYGTNQDAHPHPAFSPDGKKVVFTSDKDGLPGIYLVDIEQD